MISCQDCSLCEGRQNLVMPDGDPKSPVAFVGEAPGADEDKVGKPFIGKSGKVLSRLMEEVGLARSTVFITNTVKCRPPNNRAPTSKEMEACYPRLEQELKDRKLIIALGRSAAKDLIGRDVKMSSESNTMVPVTIAGNEINVLIAYHPAATFYSKKALESLKNSIEIAKEYMSSK